MCHAGAGGRGDAPQLQICAAGQASEPGLSVIPQATPRKGCLKLWRTCAEPGGVLACPGTMLLSQLKKTFLHRVRGKYPGQLEIGNPLPSSCHT